MGYIFIVLSVTIIRVFLSVHTKFLKYIFFFCNTITLDCLTEDSIQTFLKSQQESELVLTIHFLHIPIHIVLPGKNCNDVFISMLKEVKLRTLTKKILPINL